jgi:hypothetical protein
MAHQIHPFFIDLVFLEKEAEMALEFDKRYTKPQILEMYFNKIYFGNGAKGIVQTAPPLVRFADYVPANMCLSDRRWLEPFVFVSIF